MIAVLPIEIDAVRAVYLEDLALDYGCELDSYAVVGTPPKKRWSLRWSLRGSDANVTELLDRLNDEGIIAVVGHGTVEAP